jgi:hypothetical protein
MVDFKKYRRPNLEDLDWDNIPEADPAPAPPEFESPWGTPIPTFTYLAGAAGSGKTYQTKLWQAETKGLELCATTGIAALNLGGSTINSLLGYFDTQSLHERFVNGQLTGILRRLYGAGLRRLVIDEVSMMDGDQLTYLVRAIEEVNGRDYFQDERTQHITSDPLGLTLVGDFAQLPPVKAIYAFESAEWGRFVDTTHTLTEIRRQADPQFIQALRDARRGDGRKAIEFFRDRLIEKTDDSFEGTTLFAKNDAVDRYNQLRLDKLTTPLVFYPSERWGKQRSEWGNPEKAPYTWGIPQRLPLKVGSWVMILTNVWLPGRPKRAYYVNGDCGEVTEANPEDKFVKVKLQRTGQEVSVDYCHREVLVPIDSARRTALRAEGKSHLIAEGGKYEITGAIDYMPIRLAWASTVHKSQGLSLDRLQMNINDPFFKSHGMAYVALSRARTAEGLHIIGRPETFIERCAADPKLKEYL